MIFTKLDPSPDAPNYITTWMPSSIDKSQPWLYRTLFNGHMVYRVFDGSDPNEGRRTLMEDEIVVGLRWIMERRL